MSWIILRSGVTCLPDNLRSWEDKQESVYRSSTISASRRIAFSQAEQSPASAQKSRLANIAFYPQYEVLKLAKS